MILFFLTLRRSTHDYLQDQFSRLGHVLSPAAGCPGEARLSTILRAFLRPHCKCLRDVFPWWWWVCFLRAVLKERALDLLVFPWFFGLLIFDRFHSHGSMDMALEERDDGDSSSARKWALGSANMQDSLVLCHDMKFTCFRDHPRPSNWTPFPGRHGYEIEVSILDTVLNKKTVWIWTGQVFPWHS